MCFVCVVVVVFDNSFSLTVDKLCLEGLWSSLQLINRPGQKERGKLKLGKE